MDDSESGYPIALTSLYIQCRLPVSTVPNEEDVSPRSTSEAEHLYRLTLFTSWCCT